MEKISDIYSDYKEYILFIIVIIISLILSGATFYYFSQKTKQINKKIEERPVVEVQNKKTNTKKFIVDIKGEVKTPGVYIMEEDSRVIDVVKKAGGFTSEANSFVNNLSMKIKDEMVIVIYSKKEIKDYLKTKEQEEQVIEKCNNDIIKNDTCIETQEEKQKETRTSTNTKKQTTSKKEEAETNKLVSINTATKEELMTLSGIGESKAEAIIEYRKTKRFETIEEIKEVLGIGDSLFEKIKDYITT